MKEVEKEAQHDIRHCGTHTHTHWNCVKQKNFFLLIISIVVVVAMNNKIMRGLNCCDDDKFCETREKFQKHDNC